jgi:2-C-methyl-D-erythritol 2,4-cyclodiphosphate synthase
VHAKRPKLRPYIEEMRKNLSEDLQVSADRISVKATTTEHLGFVGREEGIAAEAVVLLQSVSWKKSYGS